MALALPDKCPKGRWGVNKRFSPSAPLRLAGQIVHPVQHGFKKCFTPVHPSPYPFCFLHILWETAKN